LPVKVLYEEEKGFH